MGSRRMLHEAFLGEAMLEVPDGDLEAMKRVLAGAIKRRALPLSAKDWWASDSQPKQRRASDRAARGTEPPPPPSRVQASNVGGPVVSKRTGRSTPTTNRFVQQARQDPPPDADDFADEPTDPGVGPPIRRRDGDREEFPDLGAAEPAAFYAPGSDDRVLSHGFLDPSDDSVDVPEPGGGRTVRTLKPASKAKRKPGSIAGLFRRRPPDGRKQLDKALKAADRDAQRKAGKQGVLNRLIRGKDVTR